MSVIIEARRYPSLFPPGNGHWEIDEAWRILDMIKDGVISDDVRAFLNGAIAGALMRERARTIELEAALGTSCRVTVAACRRAPP